MEVHPAVGLLLLAIGSGLAPWWPSRAEPVWRWASLGTLLWGVQAVVWLLERRGGLEAPLTPSGVLLFAAALTWAATLRQLPLYEPPA